MLSAFASNSQTVLPFSSSSPTRTTRGASTSPGLMSMRNRSPRRAASAPSARLASSRSMTDSSPRARLAAAAFRSSASSRRRCSALAFCASSRRSSSESDWRRRPRAAPRSAAGSAVGRSVPASDATGGRAGAGVGRAAGGATARCGARACIGAAGRAGGAGAGAGGGGGGWASALPGGSCWFRPAFHSSLAFLRAAPGSMPPSTSSF